MNTKRSVTWGLLAGAAACAAMAATPGCELIVDFDRSKIPTADASLPDVEIPDVVTTTDSASDAGASGDSEATDGSEAGTVPDAGTDATVAEGGATPDAEAGAPDTGVDAAPDVVSPSDAASEDAAEASIPEAGEQ
jgi:hypothetical protein